MSDQLTIVTLPHHQKLGRHVRHDEQSRDYDIHDHVADVEEKSTRHISHVGILNQYNRGACTGFSSGKSLTYQPLWPGGKKAGLKRGDWHDDNDLCLGAYSDAEIVDGGVGLPDEDEGSSGLSVAKVWARRGAIAGYRHAFSPDDGVKALVTQPIIMGIPFYEGMFTPDADGFIAPAGTGDTLAGGHEMCLDEVNFEEGYVGGPNSWGASWGPLHGRYRIRFDVWAELLAQQGDLTIFTPLG